MLKVTKLICSCSSPNIWQLALNTSSWGDVISFDCGPKAQYWTNEKLTWWQIKSMGVMKWESVYLYNILWQSYPALSSLMNRSVCSHYVVINMCFNCLHYIYALLKMYLLMAKDQVVFVRVTLQHVELTSAFCQQQWQTLRCLNKEKRFIYELHYTDRGCCANFCNRWPLLERHENSSRLSFPLHTETDRPVFFRYHMQESRPSRTQDNRWDSSVSCDTNTLPSSLLLCCKQTVDYFDSVLTLLYL